MFAAAFPTSTPPTRSMMPAGPRTVSGPDDAVARDPAAADRLFKELVASHRKSLQAFVFRKIGNPTDAEELTQQAFVEAARTLATFRGESALSTWLYGIAMNLVRNHLSRAPQRRYAFEDETVLETVPSPTANPERRLEAAELLARLDAEMAGLPVEMREVLMLIAVDEVSYEEAAVLLSVPIGTVRSRLSRARSTLRARLASAGVEDLH